MLVAVFQLLVSGEGSRGLVGRVGLVRSIFRMLT